MWPFRKRQPSEDEVLDIESAIAKLCEAPSQSSRLALYRTLGSGSLYIATGAPPGGWPAPQVELMKDTSMPVHTTTAPDGGPAVMAFTTLDHLRRRSPHASGHARMSVSEVLDMVLNGPYDALVLNPAGPWAAVPREDVEKIRKGVWHAV
jgi:hypothetical protein